MGTELDLGQILKDLENTSTLDELGSVAIRLRDFLKVEHLTYHWVDAAGDQYGYTTYSDAWDERYREKNYHRIDPVILGCFQRFHPVDWKSLDWSGKVSKAFLQDALELLLNLTILAWCDDIKKLDNCHFRPQPCPDRAEFQPDHTGPDHHQVLRHLVQL